MMTSAYNQPVKRLLSKEDYNIQYELDDDPNEKENKTRRILSPWLQITWRRYFYTKNLIIVFLFCILSALFIYWVYVRLLPRFHSPSQSHNISIRHPKQVGYFFHSNGSVLGHEEFSNNLYIHQQHPIIDMDDGAFGRQAHLRNSKDYSNGRADPLVHDDCIQQYDWQLSSFPTCNFIHELELGFIMASNATTLVGSGNWRDVWSIHSEESAPFVLKTLSIVHDWTERNFDRHRRDAVASERLTKSPFVLNIYAFCGNSVIAEHGERDLKSYIEQYDGDGTEALVDVAHQVASGIADLHNIPEGFVTIAHTDITPDQFIHTNGFFKLNDFNRCRFITRSIATNKTCPFFISGNYGKFRSPEEYSLESISPLDEKIDVYSMGNIFYYMLTKKWPFQHVKESEAQKRVRRGERPNQITEAMLNSTNWATKTLIQAMKMCWVHNATIRPTARFIQEYLKDQITARLVQP